MKDFIKMRIREWGFDDIKPEEFIRAYTNKINNTYDNLLVKVSENPNYSFILRNQIKMVKFGEPNRCETNTYNFVKERLKNGEDFYFPVGGFSFQGPNLWPLEHWWVYNKQEDNFLEVTPLEADVFRAYAGVINTEIQKDILTSNNVFDIDFFKGGNVMRKYFK